MILNHKTFFFAALFTLSCAPAIATQKSCRDVGLDPNAVSDGETYIRTSEGWELFDRITDLEIEKFGRAQVVYIVKDENGIERNGVVLVKSGRVARNSMENPVLLVRRDAAKLGRCAQPEGFADTQIPGNVYDGYHDYGRNRFKTNHLQTLRRFHIQFGHRCERTDYVRWGYRRHVSNRSAFSYDPDVVDKGIHTPLDAALENFRLFTPAVAKQSPYGERRTEIKQYVTNRGVACVAITTPVSNRGSFLRIKDLTGRHGELRY